MTLGEYIGAGSDITKGLWHFNGDSNDSSGNSNNGTDTDITYGNDNGRFGQGGLFNGSSSRVYIGTPSSLNLSAALTISCWICPSSYSSERHIIHRGIDTTSYRQWILFLANYSGYNEVYFGGSTGGTNATATYIATAGLANNVWLNPIATYDGTTRKLYINSEFRTSENKGNFYSKTSNVCQIGATALAGYYAGKMDEMIVENRAWTQNEINKYYTMAKGRFGV